MSLKQPLISPAEGDKLLGKRVAVIGGGWAGVQILQSLKEHGVTDVTVFERWNGLGGTWHPNAAYADQEIHGPIWHVEYPSLKFSEDDMVRFSKAKAPDIQAYQHRFIEVKGLAPHIEYGSSVVEINYDTSSNTAKLVVKDSATSKERTVGPFDLVAFCSVTGKPSIPSSITNKGFKGPAIHCNDVKPDVLMKLIQDKKRVGIVGAGKSGADAVLMFLRRGYKEITWIQRAPYWFWIFETVPNGQWGGTWRGWFTGMMNIFLLAQFRFFPQFAIWLMWLVGHAIRMPGPKHWDARKFHLGLLDFGQRKLLQEANSKFGDPDYLSSEGMHFKDGSSVALDAVIYCTGYTTGLEDIRLVKDGQPYKLRRSEPLFEHMLIPDFPCLLVAAASFFTFGPVRSVATAGYIVNHLCRGRLKEDAMRQDATSLLCKQDAVRLSYFSSESCFVHEWMKFFHDQWRMGYLTLSDFLHFVVGFFCYGNHISPFRYPHCKEPKY